MKSKNEQAMIGHPIYLIIVLVVVTTILTIFSLSIFSTTQQSHWYQIQSQINKIESEATNMFEYADEGSLRTLHVDFPSSMRCLVFGSIPKNGNLMPTNHTLDEDSSNNYYLIMDEGTIYTYHSNARFSGINETTFAVLSPGSYDLTLELVKWEEKTYVKIYEQQ